MAIVPRKENMLNGRKIIIRTSEDLPSFEPLPDDKYTVQIVDVTAVDAPNPYKGGAVETKFNFQFVQLDDKKEAKAGGPSLRGRYLWKKTSTSMHEKSWLRKLAKAVYGRDLTIDEQKSFDPESIIGKRVDVMTEQSPSKDGSKIYANIISFTKASPKGCMGQELESFDYEAAKAKTLERKSQAIPEAKKDNFIAGLEKDNAEFVSQQDVDEIFGKEEKKKK